MVPDLELEHAWTDAVASVLARVRTALDFEMAVVSRRTGSDYVVLGASDAVYGVQAGDVLPWDDTFCARATDGRAPHVVPDVRAVPAYLEAGLLLGMTVGAYVSLPLRDVDGALLGTLCAASPRVRGASLADAEPELTVLADVLGSLLGSELRLSREIRRSERAELTALVDPLTELGNRRLWDRRLASEERRCAAYGLSAAVVALDMDGLKAVNDEAGHDAGDALLEAAAQALTAVAAPDDVVARTGGDEFALLLPESDAVRLAQVVGALRGALTERGLSAGIGAALRGSGGLAQAWRDADARLLLDKSSGPRRSAPTALSVRRRTDESADEVLLRELLDLARRQLGASIAFVGEWTSGMRVMRGISSAVPLGIGRGSVEDLDATYCQRILDGRLPRVIPDSAAEPEAMALEVTAKLPIGSYVGVPVILPGGELYGTLCCLSPTPDPALSERDADFLMAIADSMARVLDVELRTRAARGDLVARLDPVLRGDGLRSVYQPVLSLVDGGLVGFEALSRFGPDGTGAPTRWFEDAVRAGLGVELELAAARAAVVGARDLPGWLALNVSATTIVSPAFDVLIATVEPTRLVLEISEHEEVEDYLPLLAALRPLRDRGVRVAVDDAGAGFASLRHVVLLTPDIIKLDISLVRGIDADPPRQALAAALTTFARSTGAQVVAEGVETEQERDVLTAAGVDLVQGWLFGRAVPADQLAQASVTAGRCTATASVSPLVMVPPAPRAP